MKNKTKRTNTVAIMITLGVVVCSWFHVAGKEIDGTLEISPECTVTIRVGRFEVKEEYVLDAGGIEALRELILTSSFIRDPSFLVTFPTGTEHYTILIAWNNYHDFLHVHCIGNYYISIPDQFGGKHLKVRNPDWGASLKKIISLSKPSQ
ncbi:MAG: hypothetical protein ACOX34_03430 [Bacillota bacterium]|nr:hypothetical protein [Candidatus Fermentithermobacillaceae bacterium]